MLRKVLRLAILALLGTVVGCGDGTDTPEGVMRQYIRCVNDASDVLSGVKDEASAKAAKPKLEKLGERQKSLMDQWMKFSKEGKLKPADLKQFEGDLTAAMQRFTAETKRIVTIPGGLELTRAWAMPTNPLK